MFRVAPSLDLKKLEAIFRHRVFKMLLVRGRITKDLIAMLSNWRHSGFQVFCGSRFSPKDETAMENLSRNIIQASFLHKRMTFLPDSYFISSDNRRQIFIIDAVELVKWRTE